jgi:hypothetical protein
VSLIELAATDISLVASDDERLVKFLVERIIAKPATDDKTRACAILALGSLPKHAREGRAPATDVQALVTDIYSLSGTLSLSCRTRAVVAL